MCQVKIAVLMPDDAVRASFIPKSVAEEMERLGDVWWNPAKEQLSLAALKDALRGANICVTGWGCLRLDEAALENADALKLHLHTGGSVAPYVSQALYDRGVRVASGNEIYAEIVGEGALAYILCGLRRIPTYNDKVQSGGWGALMDENESLMDQTVGLIGMGAVARNLARLLPPFRAKVMGYDPYVSDEVFKSLGVERALSMEPIFEQCRVLSLHLPRTQETHHIIDRALLERMQPGALLVNTARGSVVDEKALAEILRAGKIRAVLDVYEQEPLGADSPLRGLENVILMPHMAGPTKDRRATVTRALIGDAQRFLSGAPLLYEVPREYALSMTDDRLQLG